MNQTVLAGIIFVGMYLVIVSEKIHRTIAAMLGAVLMIACGILTEEQALHHIDFNTLGLLVGMMMIVAVTSRTGLFNYAAVWAAKKAQARPVRILIYLAVLTAVLSAFLDNVTTVLLIVPVTFEITRKLRVNPMPYLLLQILASNIGGTATLIGEGWGLGTLHASLGQGYYMTPGGGLFRVSGSDLPVQIGADENWSYISGASAPLGVRGTA